MGLKFKISDIQMLQTRNKLLLENGIPLLIKNNFEKSPFTTAWYGKNNLNDYTYELCRLSKKSLLECLTIHISKGDNWIKFFLNIFELSPMIKSIQELNNVDGLNYLLPPNSINQMRLRVDGIKTIPLFNFKQHRIKSFGSERKFNKRINELKELLIDDCSNINFFIKRWHELYRPNNVDWEGNILT